MTLQMFINICFFHHTVPELHSTGVHTFFVRKKFAFFFNRLLTIVQFLTPIHSWLFFNLTSLVARD